MTRTRLILTGVLAGAMLMGTACSSTRSAHRQDSEPTQGTGGAGSETQEPGIYPPYTVPQEDRAGPGGTGYSDPVTHPDSSSTSNSKLRTPDVRDQDPVDEPGIGGSGYEDDSLFRDEDMRLGGDRFPGDHNVPQ